MKYFLIIIAAFIAGCKNNCKCDQPLSSDTHISFMVNGGDSEKYNGRVYLNIAHIVDPKDWVYNQYFTGCGFSKDEDSSYTVPLKDSCILKKKYIEFSATAPKIDTAYVELVNGIMSEREELCPPSEDNLFDTVLYERNVAILDRIDSLKSALVTMERATWDTMRHFYYVWYYNDATTDAWGENDFYLNRYPTQKDIIKEMGDLVGKKWVKSKIHIEIQEVTDDQLSKLLSPEAHEAKGQAAYYRAIHKQ
jgi:hypothetical protein